MVADPSLPPCQELLAAYRSTIVGSRGAGQFLSSYWKSLLFGYGLLPFYRDCLDNC